MKLFFEIMRGARGIRNDSSAFSNLLFGQQESIEDSLVKM
jgi:hypothetical protein